MRAVADTTEKFLRRKNLNESLAGAELPVAPDPQAQAAAVAKAWMGSVQEIINAGLIVSHSIREFEFDDDGLQAFVDGLVQHGVLSRKEALKGRHAPKLVKLRKIGENADWLRRDDVLLFLPPSYSSIYQSIVLRDLVEGSDEEKTGRLLSVFKSAPDEVTREYLSDRTDELKKARTGAASSELSRSEAKQGPPTPTNANKATVALLTPTEEDLRAISAAYAGLDELDRRLPVLRELRACENLGLVMSADAADLIPRIEKLLTLCGFSRPGRVYLPQPRHDITKSRLIVIGVRGNLPERLLEEDEWPETGQALYATEIATLIFPAADHRLHIFAQENAAGWECLSHNEAWIQPTTHNDE